MDNQNTENNENREYTIKIIPDQGGNVRSIKVPIKLLKYGAASLAAGALLFVGAFGYAAYTSYSLQSDASRIQDLQDVNNIQQEQLLQLSKKANSLQDELDELGQMEQELRQISGIAGASTADGNAGNSNSNSNSNTNSENGQHNGQGGPVIKPDIDNVSITLNEIEKKMVARKASLFQLKEAMKQQQQTVAVQNQVNATIPSIWPAGGDVSSPYGLRWGGSDFHPGVDIANDFGTPIVATADGVVVVAGWNSGGYGNMVDIDHGNGITTRYGHAQQVAVTAGQQVKKGQVIAYMGSTGFSTGPHVHYEVRINGQAVNPVGYL